MTANEISLDKAKSDKLFYFVVNAVVYRASDQRCLILKRGDHEVAHPGKWGVCGGKLEWSDLPVDKPGRVQGDVLDYPDAITDLIRREVREEAGVEVIPEPRYLYSMAYIRPDGVPTVMVKFAIQYQSGEVKIESAFSDHAWVNATEVTNYECMDGITDEISSTIALFAD